MKGKMLALLTFGLIIVIMGNLQAQVVITPNPTNIDARIGETRTYEFSMTNNFDFDVFEFTFGNLTSLGFNFPPNTTLFPNTTRNFNLTVSPTTSFSGQSSQEIEFKFFADIPTAITTYHVNITPTGFDPGFVLIRAGDTITWHNNDTIIHNVFTSQFNVNLQPGETFSHTYTQTGTFTYIDTFFDEFTNFHGEIQVINRTSQEKAHNPNHDIFWNLNINFFLNPTNLAFETLEDSFQVSASGETEGSLRVRNDGNEIAERIQLSSDSNWISFSENNFDLAPDQQNIVTYTISPLIFSTEESNRTYTLTLTASGSNTEVHTSQISVFVPFTEVFTDGTSPEFIFSLLDKFCRANPTNVFCNTNQTIIVQGNESNQSITLNVTSQDFFDLKRDIGGVFTTLIRNENDLQILRDIYEEELGQLNTTSSQALKIQEDLKQDADRGRALRWTTYILLILFSCAIVIFFKTRKVKRLQGIKEGAYNYTNYG